MPAMAELIVIALRLVVPTAILRWPLAGGIVAMVLDAFDVVLVDFFAGLLGEPLGFGTVYPKLDKWLDTYYLTLELIVSRRWTEEIPRRAVAILYAWRVIGVLAFEATGIRPLLLVFPNLFENVFLYILVVRRWFPRLMPRTNGQMVLVSAILLIPKELQEYVLHYAQIHPYQLLRELLGLGGP
jgi:hypothetical protein